MADALAALKGLLRHVDAKTCLHEERVRGGTIWTICHDCGMKWADDQGGFQPHVDKPAVAEARRVIAEATSAPVAVLLGRPTGPFVAKQVEARWCVWYGDSNPFFNLKYEQRSDAEEAVSALNHAYGAGQSNIKSGLRDLLGLAHPDGGW